MADKISAKDSILPAACACFSRYGFHGTTVRMIAEQAGVPLGSLHYHYGNKEALFKEVIAELLARARQLGRNIESALAGLRAQGAAERQCIETMFSMWVDFHFDNPEVSQIALHQIAEYQIDDKLAHINEVVPTDDYVMNKVAQFLDLPNTRAYRYKIMSSNMAITGFVGGSDFHRHMLEDSDLASYRSRVKQTIIDLYVPAFSK